MFYIIDVQEVWKVSTTAGGRRGKKGFSMHEASTSGSQLTKEPEALSKQSASAVPSTPLTNQLLTDSPQVSFPSFFFFVFGSYHYFSPLIVTLGKYVGRILRISMCAYICIAWQIFLSLPCHFLSFSFETLCRHQSCKT